MAAEALPEPLAALLHRSLPPLSPSKPHDVKLRTEIDSLPGASDALRASLHLLNDDIERAHDIVSDLDQDQTCNVVHAILHRREKDYWNSCYWWKRLRHPLVKEVHGDTANACQFVNAVEAAEKQKSGSAVMEKLKQKQWVEMSSLVDYALAN